VRHQKRHLWRPHHETLVCAFRGHVLPAAEVKRLRSEDAGLGLDLPDGRRLARCLRCDSWVEVEPEPLAETLPPLEELELPRRGKALRDAIVLRLIAIDRGIHCVLFGALATILILLEVHFGPIRSSAQSLLDALNRGLADTGQDQSRSFLVRELHRFLNLNPRTVVILAGTAVAYSVVEGVEAVGLWLEKRWAEYLTAVATAGFLPFEINELIKSVTVLRIIALVVNLAILAWLLWKKRLFGIGGGPAQEEEVDRRAIFGPPAPAA
jgi:uncharacterized membrane protein (DUF2068 family)